MMVDVLSTGETAQEMQITSLYQLIVLMDDFLTSKSLCINLICPYDFSLDPLYIFAVKILYGKKNKDNG